MTKLLCSAGLALVLAMTSLLAGCQLYFGDRDDDDRPGRDDRPPHFSCDSDLQCSPGCFCSEEGICEEAGFCKVDRDCGTGFICDEARNSCKPSPVPACTTNGDCEQGSACGEDGLCVVTCQCASDAEAVTQGAGWCDEARGTCMIGSDPAGACLGEIVNCTTAEPNCPAGEVALIKDGCYTGQCRAIAACEGAPACGALQHQADCTSRAGETGDCKSLFTGHNCEGACQDPSGLDCKCETYSFTGCEAKASTLPAFRLGL
jgi:hypothetical protein